MFNFDQPGVKRSAGPSRLTNYIRQYGNVCQTDSSTQVSVQELLQLKKLNCKTRLECNGVSWTQIKNGVNSLTAKSLNLSCYWRDIYEAGRKLSPELDARDDVCSFLFQLTHLHKVLPVENQLRIRQAFGYESPALIDKVHKSVQKIVELVGKEHVLELMKSLCNSDETDLMFGANIRVRPPVDRFNNNNYGHLSEAVRNVTRQSSPLESYMDVESLNNQVEAAASNGIITDTYASSNSSTEVYDVAWVQTEMLCSDQAVVEGMPESVISLLTSARSSEELQNDLFDLLGYERIELIQKFLEKRPLMSSGPSKKEKLAAIRAGMNGNKNCNSSIMQNVSIMTAAERKIRKEAKKEERLAQKKGKLIHATDENDTKLNLSDLRDKRTYSLLKASPAFVLKPSTPMVAPEPKFPHVYDGMVKARQAMGCIGGQKLMLPTGYTRDNSDPMREEVVIPLSEPAPPTVGADRIPISSLDPVGQIAFKGCETLNRIQSVVYQTAYHTNNNLLICAPTGAGKTNIAMLTIVHQIRQHMDEAGVIQKDKFKIVYVAPMKALAAEMTANFGKRLSPLGLSVRELTGDMSLTKHELMSTNMLVTTPEKWDVTTRKPGDTQLAQLVKLLIIDEVHLLHGDRGPVLEALVARTLRMTESLQSMIRIVGLSATLPNYIDVASFLHVNPYKGLFFFDSRFRPVPLGLTFIGIKAKGRFRQMEEMDRVVYDKALDYVQKGHQVMIFVHARNGTLKTAENVIKLARENGTGAAFKQDESSGLTKTRNDLSRSRNKKLVQLFESGFGVHHAGLLRSDRTMVERLFGEGKMKVLVCTATLAWGVNLPAHAVIIRGTDIFDSKKGEMVDLGILDVLQIFGRAGRPQFDTSGQGIIITPHAKLSHYLSLLTNQYPIESSFINYLADNLNAEVTLGTVTNIEEAKTWLKYTYLYVRMLKNPQVYGLMYKDAQYDPNLIQYRESLIVKSAETLDKAHMVRYDHSTGYLHSTDLGRVASQYYIKYDTVEVFNEFLRQVMNEADILGVVSKSSEFQQVKVRDEEMKELDDLLHGCEVASQGGVENVHGKVNVLLQAHISRTRVEGFSLVSDMNYVCDNSVRITRALFEIVLHKNWPLLAGRLLNMAKMLEKRLWGFQSPMRQFTSLGFEILNKIEDARLTVEQIREMSALEVGEMIRHVRKGDEVLDAAWQFPLLSLEATIQPITRTVLRVKLEIFPDYRWNDRVHGKQETYYIWVEDPVNNHMYHHEQFTITKKQVMMGVPQELVFTIPLIEPFPAQYIVRAISDRWLSCESSTVISFQKLVLPDRHPPHTDLLDLHPLPITALKDTKLEILYPFTHFNPIQTQLFHTLYHTDHNVLLGAPTGSGKTIAAEIAMFRVFRCQPQCKVVYIAPLKALVRERVADWKVRIEKHLGLNVVELTGDVSPDVRAIQRASVIITTPEKWDGVSRSWQTRDYVQKVALIIIDEIHLLGEDRGPVLEVIVSRTNFISSHINRNLRIVGLSTALANARDLGDWLGIKKVGLFNFRPSVRPVPLEVHIAGFPGKHYCPRMATMNKPTFKAIKQHSPDKPVLVFVSSRRQTRLTAIDLMGFVVTEHNPKQWLHMEEHTLDQLISTVKDENLRMCLSFGVGIHHAGLVERDRKLVEELFVNRNIQILVTTSTLAWGVNFPAHLVVVKGTEYFDGKTNRYVDFPITDVLQMMGRAGRPQYDDQGVAVILVHDQKKHFYKKFLYEPFPVESHLLEVLPDHINAEIVAGTISTKQEGLDYLTWTYFFRRLEQNPSYYGMIEDNEDGSVSRGSNPVNSFLSTVSDKALAELEAAYCIEIDEDGRTIVPTTLGKIASFYYLSCTTVKLFHDFLNENCTLNEILFILTCSKEYAELPVRHNEDKLNEELAKKCPLPVGKLSYDTAQTKAFLLLQAHLMRIQLPSVDYLTDTKSVLDQALRLLQAMVDIAANAGWLAVSIKVQIVMQMITQARWDTDNSLLCLPYVTEQNLGYLKDADTGAPLTSIPHLEYCLKKYGGTKFLTATLGRDLTPAQIDSISEVMNSLPKLSLQLTIRKATADEGEKVEDVHVPTTHAAQHTHHARRVCVTAGVEYTISVTFKRLNKPCQRIPAPRFPKARNEGWFLMAGRAGELLALRRVVGGRRAAQLTVTAPNELGNSSISVHLISDGLLGLDQQYDIPLRVLQGKEPAPVEKLHLRTPLQEAVAEDDLRRARAFDADFPSMKR